MTDTSPIISVRGLSCTFPGEGGPPIRALSAVDLDIARGEVTAVVGASGSGKSTLLHVLGALEPVSEGSVRVAGAELARMDERARTRFRGHHIGFVFQAFHLVPSLTVAENVALSAIVSGRRPREWRARACELLELLRMDAHADRFTTTLSGGERQRVAVARAMFGRPDVVLADEPTGNLDSTDGDAVVSLLVSAVETGHSECVVIVSHDPKIAARADRVVVLSDGHVRGADADNGGPSAAQLRKGETGAECDRPGIATASR